MTPAERLTQRASELEDDAIRLLWAEPTTARHLRRVAADMREIAHNLTHPTGATP